MDTHDRTRMLPVELLSMILDELHLGDLLQSSHVSIFWRSVAKQRPAYWRDVKLASLSTTALDFFHDRLDTSVAPGINLFVCLPEVEFPARLRSIVLPAVVRNMHRIRQLVVNFPLRHDAEVFEAMCTPAPRLEELDVHVAGDAASTAFPIALFAQHAPLFTILELHNVSLTPPDLPTALSGIRSMQYFVTHEQTFPAAVLPHCPSLKKLSIFGKRCSLSPQQQAYALSARNLESLDVGVAWGCLDVVQSLPCPSIAHVTVPIEQQGAALELLSHIPGFLELHLLYRDEMILVEYASIDSGLKRTFIEPYPALPHVDIPDIYTAEQLLSRVQEVQITSACIDLLASLRALPECTRITISTDDHPLGSPAAPLALPKLQILEIECSPGYGDADARAFVGGAVCQTRSPIHVSLDDGARRRDLTVAPSCDARDISSSPPDLGCAPVS